MSLSDLPAGYDNWKLRGPDEPKPCHEPEDDDGLSGPMDDEPERDFIMERAKDESVREDAEEHRQELFRERIQRESDKAKDDDDRGMARDDEDRASERRKA